MGKTVNEPDAPSCMGAYSLVFAPTTGVRVVPEILVSELFRELWYGDSRNPDKRKEQRFEDVIDGPSVSKAERLLLSTCRGRRRQGGTRGGDFFYAPPYPNLSRHDWRRLRGDRTMRDYFLGGPLAHQEAKGAFDKDLVVRALRGHRTAQSSADYSDKELLSLIAVEERQDPPEKDIRQNLEDATHVRRSSVLDRHDDPLAQLITEDFQEICRLEATVPRREWLFFLIAYLRTATAMWMLAHLRITVLVRNWLLDACSKKNLLTTEKMLTDIRERYAGVLHPSSSPTQEVFEHIENYMRARVELRLLVHQIVMENENLFKSENGANKRLSLDRDGAEYMPLENMLILAQNIDWERITGRVPVRRWLTREAEVWLAWRSPRTSGQGKNIDEFIRVLYRSEDDDSGSSLLIRTRPGSTTKILPGHRLLQLFAFLALKRKTRSKPKRGRGKLLLRDIESHLYDYGIDFRSSSFGRPLLIEKLVEGGLLIGSPDAGESAEVLNTVGSGGDGT